MTPTRRNIERDNRGREILAGRSARDCVPGPPRTFFAGPPHADRLRQRRTLRRPARRRCSSSSTTAAGRGRPARGRPARSTSTCRPGSYNVTLQKPGFGAKRSRVTLPVPAPHHFRLLSDGLLGYAWPKWVRGGEAGEFRVHSVEPYKLELWRYGWSPELVRGLGWYDEHGPRATMQITPDGDYTRTGVEWNKVGYAQPDAHAVRRGPRAQRPVLLPRPHALGPAVRVPLDRRPGAADGADRGAGLEHHLERLQQLRRPQQLHPRRRAAAHADRQLPAGPPALHATPSSCTWDAADVRPAVVRPPRAVQPHRLRRADHRPDRGPAGLPPRPGRVAAARLARATRASPTTSTPRRSSTTARSTCRRTAC